MYIFFNNVCKFFQLKKSIKPPEIPSKHVRNWVPKVLEQRRQGLELYLQVPWLTFTPPAGAVWLTWRTKTVFYEVSIIQSHTVTHSLYAFTEYRFSLTQNKHINYSTNVEQLNKFKLPKTSPAGRVSSAPLLHVHVAICFCFFSFVRL